MKRLLAAALFVALAAAGCKEPEAGLDHALIDRTWIAAYTLTDEGGDAGQAVLALERLRMRWKLFLTQNRGIIEANPAWSSAAAEAGDLAEAAYADITVNRLHEAHRKLGKMRLAAHEAWPEPSVIDRYLEFEETLGLLSSAAADGQITDSELQGVRRLTPEARSLWRSIELADVTPLAGENTEAYHGLLQVETDAIERLEAASASGDRAAIAGDISELRGYYLRAFKSLGDLNGLR